MIRRFGDRHIRLGACVCALVGLFALSSCDVSRFIGDDEYLLDRVSVRTDTKEVSATQLAGHIQQHPNGRWFSLLKVPMSPYLIAGTDSARWINRMLWRIGEKPVIYNATKAEKTRRDIEHTVRGMGYLHARVDLIERKRKIFKLKAIYDVHAGERYYVSEIDESIPDTTMASLIDKARGETLLREGMPFDIGELSREQGRINRLLRNNGYYTFNRTFIRFEADTTAGRDSVWLRLIVDSAGHRQYHIASVTMKTDSLLNRRTIRESVLQGKSLLTAGNLYEEKKVQDTYSNLTQLGAVVNSNIKLTPSEADSTALDAVISVVTSKPHTLNYELEGTNSAGDLGAAMTFSYQNRNLMRGSEQFSFKLRGAYEAITGLDGYDAQNYIEYGAEMSLAFPDMKIPGVSRDFRRRSAPTSEISLLYNSQDRPEFHRRVVTAVWRYRWRTKESTRQHRIDLLDLNYVFMPWISSTFRTEYLENSTSRNAILRYNYEDLFIMKCGYTLNLSSQTLAGATGNYGTNAWNLRLNIETAGNFLYGVTNLFNTAKNDDGKYTLLNIAYAQYAKGDFDFSKSFRFTAENSLAVHFGLGVAYPYGNATVLPYEKRYFSGGANSVRGWSVRELGPGSFQGANGEIDFINQTGDIKLDMNVEYRTHLFWLIDGAAFIDAGNIWTVRDYAEQPGGQFRFDTCWRQIAVAYGLGVRLNFNYFILRLDGGMKAINPAYTDNYYHYPIIHPNFKRDFSLHFAVGLPF